MGSNLSLSFRNRADSAAFYEAYVSSVLTRAGLWVVCHPWKLDNNDHSHSWDLDVFKEEDQYNGITCNHMCKQVEVKSLNLWFTSEHDYPYETVLVCSLASHQRKHQKSSVTVRDFLMVSIQTGSILWVPSGSRLTCVEVSDRDRPGYLQKTMSVSRASLRPLRAFAEYCGGNLE